MAMKYSWEGDKLKQVFLEEEKKHSPKDILNALSHLRKSINDIKMAESKIKQQLKDNDKALKETMKAFNDLAKFEDKCVKLQKEKILSIIENIHSGCYKKAKKQADDTIAKTPESYDERQVKQLPFLNYQKLLATHKKMSEHISNGMISKFLYTEPVFVNPFED